MMLCGNRISHIFAPGPVKSRPPVDRPIYIDSKKRVIWSVDTSISHRHASARDMMLSGGSSQLPVHRILFTTQSTNFTQPYMSPVIQAFLPNLRFGCS
ncbi:hypothetical protein PAXRUDRAFT_417644 [Paxillus rubicundulus Ve08.2h10]|uniref:Uncharacterized protein n=1 Tax=Paxillus rubicundulus Ve08.2h10 TaxID=930991 RepID=A0A0D0DXU5_9AGAM|nr:hypothetical protein PAXRUDRAFT_417644 [Paxillus rubicundulus Ve08.2h10]